MITDAATRANGKNFRMEYIKDACLRAMRIGKWSIRYNISKHMLCTSSNFSQATVVSYRHRIWFCTD